jgi:hypothetical protein
MKKSSIQETIDWMDRLNAERTEEKYNRMEPLFNWAIKMLHGEIERFQIETRQRARKITLKYPILADVEKGYILSFEGLQLFHDPNQQELIKIDSE